MLFDHRSFTLCKDASHAEQNQDACAADGTRGIAVIADGVSSSLFAARWAQLLVEATMNEAPDVSSNEAIGAWLAEPRRDWRQGVDVENLAWHQKAKFAEGAASTLLWVEVDAPDHAGRYTVRGYAVGDCCLFHVRGGDVLRAFPLENSKLYDTQPGTIGSAAQKSASSLPVDTLDDVCRSGDLLVLCTDALAVWALQQLECGKSPHWESYWTMPEEAWTDFILRLRGESQIRYDDTTALVLRLRSAAREETRHDKDEGVIGEIKKGFSSLLSGGKTRRR